MNQSNWGITESEARELYKNHGGKVVCKSNDSGPPTVGKLLHFNKKHANVQCGTFIRRYRLSDLRIPTDLFDKVTSAAALPAPPAVASIPKDCPLPPEYKPTKATPIVHPVGSESSQGLRGNILLVAAKLENNAAILRKMREDFQTIERDYVAMKALRDEEKAKLDRGEADHAAIKKMLDQAVAQLLTAEA